MMRVRIGEFVAAVCVVAWGVAQVWAAPGAIGVSCCCVLVFCLLWCDAAQGEVGRRVLYQWTQAAVLRVGFQSGWFPSNVARNSHAHISDIEMWSLGLQRLWPISKNDRVKLRATFAGVVTVVTFRSHYSPGNRDLACRCALH